MATTAPIRGRCSRAVSAGVPIRVRGDVGLLDIAYLPPEGVRNDYGSCWGTDDLSCLSRYDGLMYFRINPLGAWCLGQEKNYEPAVVPNKPLFQVLPNRDVVAADRPLAQADALFLERFARRKSEAVWQLDAGKILESVPQVIWVRSLVPKEKNSALAAIGPAVTAARGTSIIVPIRRVHVGAGLFLDLLEHLLGPLAGDLHLLHSRGERDHDLWARVLARLLELRRPRARSHGPASRTGPG